MRAILAGADMIILRHGAERQVIPYLCGVLASGGEQARDLGARLKDANARIERTKKKFGVTPHHPTAPLNQPVSTPGHRATVKTVMDATDAIYGQDPARKDSYPETTPSSRGLQDLLGQ